ncbi:MAG: hypothetical protein AAF493_04750 [Pseudomonadota bacterium]
MRDDSTNPGPEPGTGTGTGVRPFNDLFEGLPGAPFASNDESPPTVDAIAPSIPVPKPDQGPGNADEAWILAFREKRAEFEAMQRRIYAEYQALREENQRLVEENMRTRRLVLRLKRLLDARNKHAHSDETQNNQTP